MISLDPITTVPYKLELAENKRVSESRFMFLDVYLDSPEYNQALPDP